MVRVTFYNISPREISLQRLQLETLNFVPGLATLSISLMMTNCPEVGVVSVTRLISTFWGQSHIFGADKARHSNLVCRLKIKSTAITHVIVLQYRGAFSVT